MVRKVKKKKSKILISVAFLLMVGITAFVYKSIIILGYQHIFEKEYDDKTTLYSSLKITPYSSDDRTTSAPSSNIELDPSVSISPDKLNSPNAILIRLKDYTILMQKNSEEKIYPASLTKMMTAIVAIENLPDLKEEIKLSNSTFQGLYEADASMAGFKLGEQVRAIDLLYGVMLPSGAECCIGLADQIAGSEQNFVKIMNQKAADLGMGNTHFENATGLHNENHYTTVKDLAILLSYALQNDTFREIFAPSHHFTPSTNKHPGGITLYSTMFKELNNQNIIDGEILEGKTGYTDEAGLCLASLAKVGKQEYILISAGAKGDHHSEQYNITDALAVYNSIGK
ncbi:D-alanyl-D-alanine carboxypeptidase DacF precursor [Clostridium homopropionicum DSM 5847]|uniref:D-alanyl-D-alanine carboxypeptidase DacF n=1 Tax=Clostridium homopropionicum DSM 5847 TaxID=1121318 RepID=A0A0L6ZAP6_9CLOT|nr:D-alanyl-D-alanine carboxypeptidase [Clostridium homopropionicum]KOA20049.1 D-alanyl-D-alanine carboxypeptidase DacF precursor [Clostridium homopropionicum DSM 5847]SFG65851.1 D-alanyl-D-alanine carboxypeptidase (penicillin-binding protein 5/6) [Clostridium homopropionicum]